MSIYIHEVYDIAELHAVEAEYASANSYRELYRTANSVIMRRYQPGIWWVAAVAAAWTVIMFVVRANAFEWQPLIATSIVGGATLVVWALAILGSMLNTPLVEIKITGYGKAPRAPE